MHRCLLLFIHFLLIFLELFRSPLLVSGTNYHATSRLRHPVCEFTAVVWRLVFSAFPFLSFSSACEREVTSVVIGYFNRFLLTYLLTYFLVIRRMQIFTLTVACRQHDEPGIRGEHTSKNRRFNDAQRFVLRSDIRLWTRSRNNTSQRARPRWSCRRHDKHHQLLVGFCNFSVIIFML